MKRLILAAIVAVGVLGFASTADAQYRRGTVVYSYPSYSYSYPTYSYPMYSYPSYYYPGTRIYSSSYTPITDTGVVVTSGYTPVYSSSYYSPWTGSYYGSYPSYYGSYPSYYGGYYGGSYIDPRGGVIMGRRAWRW